VERLPEWRDLYVMLGGAAAALIGLLFVTVSLHAAALSSPRLTHLRALAAHALVCYLLLVLLSILLLIPFQSAGRLGTEIALLGAVALVWLVRFVTTVARSRDRIGVRRAEWARTIGVSGATAAALLAIGCGIAAGVVGLIDSLPIFAVVLLLTAVLTSWDLLLRIPVNAPP
jgi:modulator of FtsH protease